MSILVVLACLVIDAWDGFKRFVKHPFLRRKP